MLLQFGQTDRRGSAIDFAIGSLYMQTFMKLPMHIPNQNTKIKMTIPDIVALPQLSFAQLAGCALRVTRCALLVLGDCKHIAKILHLHLKQKNKYRKY
jgi:hypothetical protein